ncbi:hypothetical protein [Risungbinella massiliensis]|uniref:hypothetical protein n=1 Tax=Risungbinella massiliensis TaxID=1329796 RepID=UPI0005CBB33B|nr:hypothetical protein [Risungbinella massiliensis]
MSNHTRVVLWGLIGILHALSAIVNSLQGELFGSVTNVTVAIASVIIVRHYNEKIEQEKQQQMRQKKLQKK